MIEAGASCPTSKVRTLVSKIRPPPFGAMRPNVFMPPRIWFESWVEMPTSCAPADQGPPLRNRLSRLLRPHRAPRLLTRTSRKKPAEAEKSKAIGVVGVGLVWRRIERCLRMPCVGADLRETIGGEFAVKPSCERPGLEHHQCCIRCVSSDCFGDRFWMRVALGPRRIRLRLARYPRSMSLSMTRPIRHTGPWLFSSKPVVEETRSPARPWDRRRAATPTPPPRPMRFERKSTDARLAPRDYAMYDRRPRASYLRGAGFCLLGGIFCPVRGAADGLQLPERLAGAVAPALNKSRFSHRGHRSQIG
jgi:hypothetical protein